MNVVDSNGWMEYFAGTPNAAFFAPAIQKSRDLIVPTMCLLEVFRTTFRQRGRFSAFETLAQMRRARIVPLDRPLAILAAKIGLESKLATADSIILATARAHGATLWTQDADFAHIPGVRYRAKI